MIWRMKFKFHIDFRFELLNYLINSCYILTFLFFDVFIKHFGY